jgi:preprotein translocase subunit SecE
MSTEKAATTSSLLGELFQLGLYKPTQGRIARQITGGAFALTFLVGAWRFYTVSTASQGVRLGIPLALAALGLWFSYRIVNYPKFADFLIAVEAEMNKVSWPSRAELIRSSVVVIFVIGVLSIILFGFDIFWRFFFQLIGIVNGGGG